MKPNTNVVSGSVARFNYVCERISSSERSWRHFRITERFLLIVAEVKRSGRFYIRTWRRRLFFKGNGKSELKPFAVGFFYVAVMAVAMGLMSGCLGDSGDGDVEEASESGEIPLRILAINDFHGNIASSSDSFGGVGRVDFLAANIDAARAEVETSVFVSAGDLIGGSPLISALFYDEPTIEAMNLIGLEFNGVGNHEFDEGLAELWRMQRGGAHPVAGDLDGDPFGGSDFEFLAANVIDDATGETIFPAYGVRHYEGVGVAFIGLTLEGTPNIVAQSAVKGMTFGDEAEAVNSLVPQLQEQGIEAIVVLIHEGGSSDGDLNDCGSGLTGSVAELVARFDDAVDIVIAGHTNDEFVCEIESTLVTMADTRGRLFTVIDVGLDRGTGDLTVRSVENRPNVQEGVSPDPDLTALIDRYDALSADLSNKVIGSISADITSSKNSAGESALGDVIADGQLASTRAADVGGAVVAFMNPGGIRADILFDSVGQEADGEVTYGEAFSVHPFGNSLVTMSLTGAQIEVLLESQFRDATQDDRWVLQVSRGFSYTWDAARPLGDRIDPSSILLDGVMVDPASTYRVTVNSFMAGGGDGFSVLKDGTDRIGGEIDLDAFIAYFTSASPISPGPQDRIIRVN